MVLRPVFGPWLPRSPFAKLLSCRRLILQYPRITFVGTRESSTITMWSARYNLFRRKNVVSTTLSYILYINILIVSNHPHHLRLCGSEYFPVFVSEESIVLAIFWEGVHVLLSYRKMLRIDVFYGFTGTFQLISRHWSAIRWQNELCWLFNLLAPAVLHLIQINHQPDATVFQFIILTFVYSSTCFGRFPAHHQELNDCGGSL